MKRYKILGPHLGVMPPNFNVAPERNASAIEIALLKPFQNVLQEEAANGWELHSIIPGYPIRLPEAVLTLTKTPNTGLPTVVLIMSKTAS